MFEWKDGPKMFGVIFLWLLKYMWPAKCKPSTSIKHAFIERKEIVILWRTTLHSFQWVNDKLSQLHELLFSQYTINFRQQSTVRMRRGTDWERSSSLLRRSWTVSGVYRRSRWNPSWRSQGRTTLVARRQRHLVPSLPALGVSCPRPPLCQSQRRARQTVNRRTNRRLVSQCCH